MQQAESELRILEIQFLEPIIVDDRGMNIGLATHRHGALAVRSEQTDFPEQGALAEGLAELDELDLTRDDIERLGGVCSTLHDDIARPEMHRTRVGQQPI